MSENNLRKAIGQLLVGGFDGNEAPREFTKLITEEKLGGIILFSRNLGTLSETQELLRSLESLSPTPLLFSIDQEGGRVERLKAPFPELPPMKKVGALGKESTARKVGQLLAQALRAVGFHQDYAPVLDVDSNPKNPIIGDRAFSSDPQVVSRLTSAFIQGLQSSGIAACGKHFPGHGDTEIDSHLALPMLHHGEKRLADLELLPFRAASAVGAASIMTAHILFPELDTKFPATLSEKIVRPILREKIGFQGVVVSDDLEMKAIADNYEIEESSVRAIRAGCDQLLICHQPRLVDAAFTAIEKAVRSGSLSESRIYESAARIEKLKQRFVYGKSVPKQDAKKSLPEGLYAQLQEELGSAQIVG